MKKKLMLELRVVNNLINIKFKALQLNVLKIVIIYIFKNNFVLMNVMKNMNIFKVMNVLYHVQQINIHIFKVMNVLLNVEKNMNFNKMVNVLQNVLGNMLDLQMATSAMLLVAIIKLMTLLNNV